MAQELMTSSSSLTSSARPNKYEQALKKRLATSGSEIGEELMKTGN